MVKPEIYAPDKTIFLSELLQTKAETQDEVNSATEEELDTKEEGYCTNSEVMTNVTLRGGIAAGRFRDRGKVPSIQACVEICCISKTCDVAFLLKNNCFSVTCLNERQCEAVKARSSVYHPQLVYIYARTKSQFIVAPAETRRGKRLKERENRDQLSKGSTTNFLPTAGIYRFEPQMHRKAIRRNTINLG